MIIKRLIAGAVACLLLVGLVLKADPDRDAIGELYQDRTADIDLSRREVVKDAKRKARNVNLPPGAPITNSPELYAEVDVSHLDVGKGLFEATWLLETNGSRTAVSKDFTTNIWHQVGYITVSGLTNFIDTDLGYDRETLKDGTIILRRTPPACQQDHLDTSLKTEVKFVESNLVATITYNGFTNRQVLNSILLKTVTNRWRWTKTKEYLP